MYREIWVFYGAFFNRCFQIELGGLRRRSSLKHGFLTMEVFNSYFSTAFAFSYHLDFSLHEQEWSQYIVENADVFRGTSTANLVVSPCAIFFYPTEEVEAECLLWFRVIEIPLILCHSGCLWQETFAMELVYICFIRVLYETEKSLTYIFFTGFYFKVKMELSCTQETSDWPKEKLQEWSFCTVGTGTGLYVTLECKTAAFSFIVPFAPKTSLCFS